jgi:putative sigma-54 modulation protein
MYASIDKMADRLERQVRRYRGRQIDRWQGQDKNVPPPEEPITAEEEANLEARIVRTKQFQMKPMGAEEAVLQMDLLDHDFYVFTSAESGDINVVYRRRDGNYGLIEPAK